MTNEGSDPLLRVPLAGSDSLAATVVVILLAASWGISYLMGGTSAFPAHLFYLPIVLSGLRFGRPFVLVTAAAATILAGPLLPADVSAATSQMTSDWAWRGVFFTGISLAMVQILRVPAQTARHQLKVSRMDQALTRAARRDELVLHYQPLVTLDGLEITGAEALVRWNHPELGLVGPDTFIPFAEQNGLIDVIGDWVIKEAARQLAEWTDAILAPDRGLFMSINISGRQLQGDHLLRTLDTVFDTTQIAPSSLILEITETALQEDPRLTERTLRALRDRGVTVAVDDFGTGQSSLVHLRTLDIDVIKIDRTFIDGFVLNPTDEAIVDAVLELSRRLGKLVIAEGVETIHQLEGLRYLGGCELAQGFLFGRPVPPHEFGALLAEDTQRVRAQRRLQAAPLPRSRTRQAAARSSAAIATSGH